MEPSRATTEPAVAAQSEVAAAVDRALAREASASALGAARVRVGASASFLALVVGAWALTGGVEGLAFVGPVLVHTLASFAFLRLSRGALAPRFAWVPAVVDVATVGIVHLNGLHLTSDTDQVAAFSLAALTLVLVLNGQTLGARLTWGTAALAAAMQSWVLLAVGLGPRELLASIAVLAVGTHMSLLPGRRMRNLLGTLVDAEVARQLEHRRSLELEAARRTIEQMLDDARRRNERLGQLQFDKDSLTQLIVHDLRGPLTAVIGNIDWIRLSLAESASHAPLQAAAGEALERAERLTSMISDLLDVAKLEEGRLQPRPVALRAREICEQVREQAARSARGQAVRIEVDVDGSLELVADRELFRRVVENLVSNALRFTMARVRLVAERRGAEIVFAVQNDGPAIAPDDRAGLFDKFRQGHNEHTGWGLGLYFCRLAAEVHGGSIAIEDVDGWNVSFVVRLPSTSALARAA